MLVRLTGVCARIRGAHCVTGFSERLCGRELEAMRREFDFWYPVDLRVSGRDLIQVCVCVCVLNAFRKSKCHF